MDDERKLQKEGNGNRYSAGGIELKPFYDPGDVAFNYEADLGDPGQYPFTRNIFRLGYRDFPWQNSFISGYGLPEEANQRQKYLKRYILFF